MSAIKQVLVESNSPEAKLDAICWLVQRAENVAAEHEDWATGCLQMAYDIDAEIAAAEIARRR